MRWLSNSGYTVATARAVVFSIATLLVAFSAAVPLARTLHSAVALLVIVNFGIGIWISMYLTMAQGVSTTHVSTAAGLLGGSGSFAGAVAMWAVGRVTQATSSFTIPLVAVAVAALLAALAGYSVTYAFSSPRK